MGAPRSGDVERDGSAERHFHSVGEADRTRSRALGAAKRSHQRHEVSIGDVDAQLLHQPSGYETVTDGAAAAGTGQRRAATLVRARASRDAKTKMIKAPALGGHQWVLIDDFAVGDVDDALGVLHD